MPLSKSEDQRQHLKPIKDAFMRSVDSALVITGDSDLATPIRFASDIGVQIRVVVPGSGQDVEELRGAAFRVDRVNLAHLAEHQFPEIFFTSKGRQIKRPLEWRGFGEYKGPNLSVEP